jgi:lysophospholipase L1-like esterase
MNRLRQNLLIAIGSILLLFVVLEVSARVLLGVEPKLERMQLHPQLGWQWTPGYDTIETYYGVDYRMKISSQGLRDKEITIPKPPDTYRIIAVGDSITEGPGAELGETFVKQLESLLQIQNPTREIEVINAGVGDYGTEQEYIWLREYGLAYEPDLIIVNVYLNDARGFKPPPALVAWVSNFFSSRSAFYYFYFGLFRGYMAAQETTSPDFRFRYQETLQSERWATDPDALTQVILEADEDWGMAWDDRRLQRMENQLTQIIRLTDQHDIDLLITILPVNVQVYAQAETPLGLDKPQQTLATFVQKQGVPVLDLLPVLRAYRDDTLFYDYAHLRPKTHRIVAEAMFEALGRYQLASFQ